MNVIKKNKELSQLKRGMNFKNYFNKNKYFFNELYKNKTLPKDEIVSIVNQILDYEGDDEKDKLIKSIAEEFVKDHHELFLSKNSDNEQSSLQKVNLLNSDNENMSKNVTKNSEENSVENHDEKDVSEKLDEIKQDVKDMELIKEHPDKVHIEEFNSKIERLRDDIDKKFTDMIDSHLELKRSIDEKRHISDHDAVSRLSNLEDKLEMLYGKQMETEIKPKPILKNLSNSKSDIMNKYISFKLNK